MPKKLRKYFKHSRRLILTRYHRLSNEKKRECDLMLLYNDDLRKAHYLKEKFYEICQNPKYSEQRTDFWDWIKEAESSGIPVNTLLSRKRYAVLYLRERLYNIYEELLGE